MRVAHIMLEHADVLSAGAPGWRQATGGIDI